MGRESNDSGSSSAPANAEAWLREMDRKHEAMVLRDHFAGQALIGMMLAEPRDMRTGALPWPDKAEKLANGAYFMADYMLQARGKEGA